MKYIKYLLLLPLSLMADTLSSIEIDKLVEHAFYTDSGYETKNLYRWNKPIHLFVNPMWNGKSPDKVAPTRQELDEIKKVTDEITQLTGIIYYIHETPLSLEETRELVMDKPEVGMVQMYFVASATYMIGSSGMASASFTNNSASIYINAHYRKSNGQDHHFVLHHIREELTNVIGLGGDTMSGTDPYSALEGIARHFGTQFSEMDRRGFYAYYAMDKITTSSYPKRYTEAEFREKIAQVQIDHEIVYGGLFEGQVDPEQTHFEEMQNPQEEKETQEETTNVNWIYFNQYPWVYSNKTNSWYYMLPRDEGIYIWSQLNNTWSKMSEAFGIN